MIKNKGMKSILGIGNALTDILAVLPDDTLLKEYHLPKGSMQHVDMETGDKIWSALKEVGVKYVPGGSAANTITCTAIFGMPSGYIGKIGNDELGHLFKSTMEQYGVNTTMLYGTKSSGRCMVFISGANAERTFADYMGSALEMGPEDLKQEYFEGYDYFHIEGYLVQNQDLILKDIVFANETEAKSFTKLEPREALAELSKHCEIAVVKVGKDGSMVQKEDEYYFIEPWPAKAIDATGAGDTYAAGFLYAHSLGMPLKVCGEIGSIIAAKVVEVIGTKIDIPRWKEAKIEIKKLIAENSR